MFETPRSTSFSFWQRTIRTLILLAIAWLIRFDLYYLIQGLVSFFRKQEISYESQMSFLRLTSGAILVLLAYSAFIFWFVHFILPITSGKQVLPAFSRMLTYGLTFGLLHGPAVFVRNGELNGSFEEINKNHPGVAFLDLRSAMTLDRLESEEDQNIDNPKQPKKVHFSLFGERAYPARIRVVGPGLTFIEHNEKITGTLDLRNQSRNRGGITADTRDGIRVNTSVSAAFTVGQPPDILDVCLNEKGDEVYVIEWDKNPPGGTRKISKLTRELNPGDEKEIINFITVNPDPITVKSDLPIEKFPFTFDPVRVERAIYSLTNLNGANKSNIKAWCDWPQDVTAELFRIMLSQKPFLSLYTSDNPDMKPMKAFKDELKIRVRNSGVLAYRVVRRQNGFSLKAEDILPERALIFYPPKNLTRSEMLRDKGIKITNAGFGDLEPKDNDVRKQLKNAWLSAKKKEEDIKHADNQLEATRIKNHARVRATQTMNYQLAKLLERHEYPREALAMLIFQELESAAANPKTRSLLPDDTLTMMTSIGQLLMQSQKNSDQSQSSGYIPANDDSN